LLLLGPDRGLRVVDDVGHIDIRKLLIDVLGVVIVLLVVAQYALLGLRCASIAVLAGAEAAEVLAYRALDLAELAWLTLALMLMMMRWRFALRCRKRGGGRLASSRACVDLHCAVLNVIVLIKLVEVTPSHRCALTRLAGVDSIAAIILTILGREVGGCKVLRLWWLVAPGKGGLVGGAKWSTLV